MDLRTAVALLVAATLCCSSFGKAQSEAAGDSARAAASERTAIVRRERNLDFWDDDTLAYYTNEYRGHDVAIMFFAQRDRNSHALAPYWDRIATLLDAGNSKSRLVMALFDCELNTEHGQMCAKLNVEFYPTLMFVGSGPYHDTDPFTKLVFGKRSAGVMGEAPVPNTVKFQGNWKYYEAIFDWIRTMQALSNWHLWTTKGFGRRLRNLLLPHKTPNAPLPVGVPSIGGKNGMATSSGNAAVEQEVQALRESVEIFADIFATNEIAMDNLLVPREYQDVYAIMNDGNIWEKSQMDSAADKDVVLYTCVWNTALDYCQRVSKKVAEDMVTDLEANGSTFDEILQMPTLEQDILDLVKKQEPYCALMDQCVLNNFKETECRPDTCPFQSHVACQHLAHCLDLEVQEKFEKSLGRTTTTA
eukprot:scaffold19424_cov142-Cylindrotheca_fusiformis.AAC.8